MWPYSPTGIQIIHEEKIQKALEHYRFSEEQEIRQSALKHIFEVTLAHFTRSSVRKPQQVPLCGNREAECSGF